MCDFVVTFGKELSGSDLLRVLRKPYVLKVPQGSALDFTWGSAAVLESMIDPANSYKITDSSLFACTGDLVMSGRDRFILAQRMSSLLVSGLNQSDLKNDPAFDRLNGAFAVMFASPAGVSVAVDPLGLTQVYAGYDDQHRLAALGSHVDIVAAVSSPKYDLDMVSIAEFLNRGAACFPYTMHANVRKCYPGSFNMVRIAGSASPVLQSTLYWSPPAERNATQSIDELAYEFQSTFRSAVADRCQAHGRLGVTLSGGLDSRLIMAVMPYDKSCLAMTFCDTLNREARTAYQVAKAYNQQWIPLYRDKEYIARSVIQNVRFASCECDWIHGHASALADEMAAHGISTVLSGYLMDTFFRGYFAKDITFKKRLCGLLPPSHISMPYDWINVCSAFCNQYLSKELKEQMFARRKNYYHTRADSTRGSIVEWLDVYPFSQRPESATWAVERRRIPQRVPAMDRRLLDFSFSCPAMLRASGKVFNAAIVEMLGPGGTIPNANNGITPVCNSLSRIRQRSFRKTQDLVMSALAKIGYDKCVQHSWHDYQQYWLESASLAMIVDEYRPHLSQFEGLIFNEKLSPLSKPQLLGWREGFRLLALAVWKSALAEYRCELELAKIATPRQVIAAGDTVPAGPAGSTAGESKTGDRNKSLTAVSFSVVANTPTTINAAVRPTQN